MLTTIRIKNLALVADLTLELQPGYNVITGETGAGKSIIIGALNLVLGERADRTLIRAGSDSCSVEAVFEVRGCARPESLSGRERPGTLRGPPARAQAQFHRARARTGSSSTGRPRRSAMLAALGEWLVDMHGPHDHQSLLHPAKQLAILDAFGGLETGARGLCRPLRRRAALEPKSGVDGGRKDLRPAAGLAPFSDNEIAAARLQPDEETRVQQEHQTGQQCGAAAWSFSQTALELLERGRTRCLPRPASLGRALQELRRLDPRPPRDWLARTNRPPPPCASCSASFRAMRTKSRWTPPA